MARPKQEEKKALTDTELQIMNILWDLESGTVHDVLERLSALQKKPYAYTTISTFLRVLEKKGIVTSEKEGRGHRYFPQIQKQKYQKKATEHLVENLFEGQRALLIKNLLGNGKLSKEELQDIQNLLKKETKR